MITKELIYGIFKEDIANLVRAEKNILLGSEEIDRITSIDFNGGEILSDLMSLLTPNTEEIYSYYEVTVVIGYTSPRVDHLLSLWKEVAKPMEQNVYDFTLDPNSIHVSRCISFSFAV